MNKVLCRMAALCLLLLGMPCFLSATTYRLKRVSSVEDEKYYVFEQLGRVMINSISSNALETTTSFKHSGISTSETYVWQIDGVSAGLRLYNLGNGKYLSAKNTGEISLSGASDAAKWLFNAQADGTVLIQDNVNSKRVMERSDNTYKTSAVTGMNLSHGIAAYLLVEEAENDPVLSFNLSMKSASLGTPFTSPELSVATGFDGTVTYSSSNERVATVDPSTGVVTLVAPGMAKIIASSAATANYQADETFYSLRVYDGDGTAEHPYSIGSLYSGDATLAAGNYFTGYVVGSLKSSSAMATTSTSNDAIVIADAPDESAIHMVLPIDLSTSLESYYGLNSHPDMLGCRVIVSGSKTSLYGLTCMDATSLSATRDVTISSACYATVGASYAMDYSGTDVRAYSAGVSGGKVELSLITDGIVPANQGTILYCATPGTYAVPVTTETGTCSDTGLGISDGSSATGSNLYVLASRSCTVGFYRWTSDSSLPKGRVYLDAAAGAPEYLAFSFGQTTDVERVTPAQPKVDEGTVYNLQGQRVERPVRGLYIMGGRKVLVK